MILYTRVFVAFLPLNEFWRVSEHETAPTLRAGLLKEEKPL